MPVPLSSWLLSLLADLGWRSVGANRYSTLGERSADHSLCTLRYWRGSLAAARCPAGSCSFTQVLTSCGNTWSSCSKMLASPTLSLVCCSSWSPCTRLSLTRLITLKAVSFIFPQPGYGRHKISNQLYQLVLIHCPKWLEVNEDF